VNVVFLCLGHGKSKAFLEQHQFSNDTKIIDLGNDFILTKEKYKLIIGIDLTS
jgi:N-acetyl-gamma-glutamyl-phosphate reductase